MLIKSFSQFLQGPINEDSRPAANSQSSGEIAKWKVKVKTTGGSDENPIQQVTTDLVSHEDFIKWWTSLSDVGNNIKEYNYQLIAFYTGKEKPAGLISKEKVKASIVFKVFINPKDYGDPFDYALYDPNAAEPMIKDVAVGNSQYKLAVWDSRFEDKMKFVQTDPANDKGFRINKVQNGQNTPNQLIGKDIKNQASANVQPAQTGTSGTSGQSANTQTAQPVQQVQPSIGKMKWPQTPTGHKLVNDGGRSVNQEISDLQSLIKAKGGPAWNEISNGVQHPIDGRYGDKTANAIGILIGTNQPENEITADIWNKLATALNGVETDQIKVSQPHTSTNTNHTQGSTGNVHTTQKGTKFIIK